MRTAAELIHAGAKPTELYEWIYETNTKPRLALRGRSLSRLATTANERIAFNAGSLTDSIVMDVQDYFRLAKPEVFEFALGD